MNQKIPKNPKVKPKNTNNYLIHLLFNVIILYSLFYIYINTHTQIADSTCVEQRRR